MQTLNTQWTVVGFDLGVNASQEGYDDDHHAGQAHSRDRLASQVAHG